MNKLPLTEKHIMNVCKFKQGKDTCAFLVFAIPNLECAKGTDGESYIAKRLSDGSMNSKGNNCDGCVGNIPMKGLGLKF